MLRLPDRLEAKVRKMVILGEIVGGAAMRIGRVMDQDMESCLGKRVHSR